MKKFPSIPHLDDENSDIFISEDDTLYILEKMDGANFRWKLHTDGDEDNIIAGSRNVEFTKNGDPLPLEETNKQFHHVIKYIKDTVDFEGLRDVYRQYGELVFFGEALHKHTVDYEAWTGKAPDIESNVPNYIGFDIWSEETEEWLSHSTVEDIHDQLGLASVPVLSVTTVGELTDEDIVIPPSQFRQENEDAENEFNRNGLAEGIVIKNDEHKTRAKRVADYMEEVQQLGTPKDGETLEELKERKKNGKRFTRIFVTEQRVLKNAYKLVDEGKYDELQMGMMEDLPKRVLTDIFEEEGWNFIMHKFNIEFTEDSKEEIRQRASKACSRILQEEINDK